MRINLIREPEQAISYQSHTNLDDRCGWVCVGCKVQPVAVGEGCISHKHVRLLLLEHEVHGGGGRGHHLLQLHDNKVIDGRH